jgi:hypothetical protein
MVVGAEMLELLDHAWGRFRDRMAGLTEVECGWQPAPADDRITLRWRLNHIAEMLWEDRNASWLGVADVPRDRPATPAGPLDDVEQGYRYLGVLLRETTDESLLAPIGPAAGRYGAGTRLSFVLHLLDEFIHHTAEAALLRDLYAARVLDDRP